MSQATENVSQLWEVKTMAGFRINTSFIVVNPTCPEGRHPTRDCGCQVFKKADKAQTYADEMNGS